MKSIGGLTLHECDLYRPTSTSLASVRTERMAVAGFVVINNAVYPVDGSEVIYK